MAVGNALASLHTHTGQLAAALSHPATAVQCIFFMYDSRPCRFNPLQAEMV